MANAFKCAIYIVISPHQSSLSGVLKFTLFGFEKNKSSQLVSKWEALHSRLMMTCFVLFTDFSLPLRWIFIYFVLFEDFVCLFKWIACLFYVICIFLSCFFGFLLVLDFFVI